jgi:NAD(P)-dependent dehydrogenase (short-subunit alcohol dehydrogenase family)
VVVTGGGSGIGEALARSASDAGARHVVVADLHGDEAVRVATDIGGHRRRARRAGRGRHRPGWSRQTQDRHGPIDLFCSNAGIVSVGGVEEPDERIQAMWEIHVLSHIYAARAVLPSMIARGEGYLLNTASAAGLLTQIGSMAYSVTKHAAVALAEWLAVSHHHQGIRVSVLCPQAVRTNLLANSPVEVVETEIGASGPAGGDGVLEPADVARACLEASGRSGSGCCPTPRSRRTTVARPTTSTGGSPGCVASRTSWQPAARCQGTPSRREAATPRPAPERGE